MALGKHRTCTHRRSSPGGIFGTLKTERTPRLMDWALYREGNVVERLVGRLKEDRRIATRYDKLAASYLDFRPARREPHVALKTEPNLA